MAPQSLGYDLIVEPEPLDAAHPPPSIHLSETKVPPGHHLEELCPYLLPVCLCPSTHFSSCPPSKPGWNLSPAQKSGPKLRAKAPLFKAPLYQIAQTPHLPPSTPENSSALHSKSVLWLTDSPCHPSGRAKMEEHLGGGQKRSPVPALVGQVLNPCACRATTSPV